MSALHNKACDFSRGLFTERSNSEAVFAHFSAIDLNEDDDSSKFLQSLKEGDRVCFNLVQGPKGMQATNI
jgi:cold shock CspA family protein